MVKIRLKRLGYKKNPTYRIVVINDLQKTAMQGLDVKNRRCKSWFSATPAPSFILPK